MKRKLLAALLLAPCFVAVYDGVILIVSWQRLQRAAASLGESVAQASQPRPSDLPPLFAFAAAQSRPEDVTHEGALIVSQIEAGASGARIAWQSRDGSALVPSRFGAPGDPVPPADVPGALRGTLIATEAAAPLSPFVLGKAWLPAMLRAWSLHRPG